MSDEQLDTLLTDDVRELLRLICQTDITELKLERGETKIHVKRTLAAAQIPANVVPAGPSAPLPGPGYATNAAPGQSEPAGPQGHAITSPMVGTFYASPSPKDPPYVKIGDEVQPGDVIGIVEAMKMMNEIECEIHGQVAAIHVENGHAVEYGQPLLTITPLE